jgi:CRISPR/Cas system-associated exonuclease Cas4 (RecB family)
MGHDARWTSASELADYAYCPRSHWYRQHPPARGPTGTSMERAQAGVRYHRRTLRAERRRAERGAAYWVGVLAGVALVVGGMVWLFHL